MQKSRGQRSARGGRIYAGLRAEAVKQARVWLLLVLSVIEARRLRLAIS